MGDEINLKATGYVIVFADNEWHGAKAYDLYHQIKGLRSDAAVMVLPVDVNAADEDPFLVRGHGSIFTIPQIP